MAKYSAVKATVNAYIKQNGRKEITGRILNAVLNATIDSLGKYFQFAGGALPTDDPGTPDQNVCYLAGEPGVYTNFGGITIENEEVALLFWNGEWTKQRILIGIREVNASVDNQVGTPSVDVSYSGGELVLTFHNLKGDQGETGDPAGFGTIGADINGGVGTPGVSVETSGDNTAKNLMFHFTNLKGETGVTSVVATIDNTSGTPSCQVSLVGQQLTLAFSGLKGLKGDTGVSADYPITIYNGLDSDATDQALAAAQGKVLDGKVSQLRQKVDGKEINLIKVYGTVDGSRVNNSGVYYADTNCWRTNPIPVSPGDVFTTVGEVTSVNFAFRFYNGEPSASTYISAASVGGRMATAPEGAAYMIVYTTKGRNPVETSIICNADDIETTYPVLGQNTFIGGVYEKSEADALLASKASQEEFLSTESKIATLSTDVLLKNRKYEYSLYNITDNGQYVANSNAATIIYFCEPNTTYHIGNPSGKRLVVGSSVNAMSNNATFEHFYASIDTEKLDYTTGGNEVYLYICYYAKASSEKTAGDALEDLTVTHKTAKDKYSRDKIDSAYNGAVLASKNIFDPLNHWLPGVNMNAQGLIVSGYSDRGVVFVPVHGLPKVTVSLLASGVTATGCRYCWYDNERAALGGVVGNVPVYGENNFSVIPVPDGAYFLGFLVYYAGVQRDSNGAPLCMVQSGDQYTGYVPFDGTEVSAKVNRPKDVYVCAKNSLAKYRQGCDFCCDGVNDELTIQAALDAIGTEGTLYLAPGIYYIDSFPQQNDGQYCAIQYRLATEGSPERRVKIKAFDQTPMRQNGYSQLRRCATLMVGQSTYNALDSNTLYSVIGVETSNGERMWNGNIFDIEGVAVEIYGNQKQVIAFDAYYAFCMMMFKCMATAIPTNAVPSTPGVDLCIGIRCTKGSNFGQESQINTCAMYGFGQGIAVMGEHYVITNAKTIYNKYGFTFNWFGSTDGGYSHPNTLINCCSEMDMNYPYFGQNTQNQSLTFIDFNMEHRTAVFEMGGNRATELVPGSWRGTIHYTIKVYGTDGYPITGNSPEMPFWADGHGANMQTINDAEPLSRSYSKVVNATGLKGKKVVCFGDSFTNYTDASNLHYTDYLERITGATMINCGIPGARLHARAAAVLAPQNDTEANAALDIINVVRASLGVDFDGTNTYKDVIRAASDYRGAYGDIVTRINSIDWSQIGGVIIQGGTNDWTNTALENTVAAINSIIELLLTNQPHLHIWWCTPTIRWDGYAGAGSDEAGFSDIKQINGKTLKEFSAGIEAAVKDNHIPVCDLYNTLGWTKYNFSDYFPDTDGVHPRKAFDKYAYRIASFIASVKQF